MATPVAPVKDSTVPLSPGTPSATPRQGRMVQQLTMKRCTQGRLSPPKPRGNTRSSQLSTVWFVAWKMGGVEMAR